MFSRTKHGANRLAKSLEAANIKAAAIHGNKSQTARTKALADFKAGTVQVMVATDIAARGIDIDQLPFVVNFDLPNVPEDYVHRIGRTGRAGATGQAVSLVGLEEVKLLHDIERLIKRTIERKQLAGFEAPFTIPEASSRSGGHKANSVKKPNPNRSKHAQHANTAQGDKPARQYDSRQQARSKDGQPQGANKAKAPDNRAQAIANGNKPPQRNRPPRRSGTGSATNVASTNKSTGTGAASKGSTNPYANAKVKS